MSYCDLSVAATWCRILGVKCEMTRAPDEPRPAAPTGRLDFSQLAHDIIQKADPEAELDAEPSDEARRSVGGD